MAHIRLRKFNTRITYPEQQLDNDLCMAVRAGNHIFLRGQVGQDLQGNMVGIGDPRRQTEQAMKNVKQLLEEAGSRLEHICKITVYITDRAYREPVYRELGRWLKGVYPCSTGLIVEGLARPEWVMEIDVEAVIPAEDAKSGKVTGPEWADISMRQSRKRVTVKAIGKPKPKLKPGTGGKR
jgi:enamine deaminase RidA (YjgF/YER057c/UK114 family)